MNISFEMEWNEQQQKIIDKANFYRENKIKAHILTIPRGTFKNGLIVSNLEDGKYFWFIELDTLIPIRLFLLEIYDIKDYQNKEVDKESGDWFDIETNFDKCLECKGDAEDDI